MTSINNLRILITALNLLGFIFATTQGFSISPSSLSAPPRPSISIVKRCASHSPLFTSRIRLNNNYIATATRTLTPTTPSQLRMTEEKEDDSTTELAAETSEAETKETQKERNGFITALVLGPPLIFKFGIVLVVKFLTDLVVFPLLFLYRICRLAKNKVVGLFIKSDDFKGDKTNGAGS